LQAGREHWRAGTASPGPIVLATGLSLIQAAGEVVMVAHNG
jgi:hypothetical protein